MKNLIRIAAMLLAAVAFAAPARTLAETFSPVASVSAANVSSLVLAAPPIARPGTTVVSGTFLLYRYSVIMAAAGDNYLMIFDASAVPPAGAVGYPQLRDCWPVSSTWAGDYFTPVPDVFQYGIVLAMSSTGCSTFTPTTALFLWGQAQ